MKNYLTILIVVVAVALIAYLFVVFGGGKAAVQGGLTAAQSATGSLPGTSALSRQLLLALSSLKDLTLDDKLFKNPVFLSLKDYSHNIPDEPIGRDNPFLPAQ